MFSGTSRKADYDTLIQEIGAIIDADKMQQVNDDGLAGEEVGLPVFGGAAEPTVNAY